MRLRFPVAMLAMFAAVAACSAPPPATESHRRTSATTTTAVAGMRVVVIGDSYTGGSGEGGVGAAGWPALVWARLAKAGIPVTPKVGALGGSGYVQRGTQTGKVFGEEIDPLVSPDTQLVVFFNGVNDVRVSNPFEVGAAALADFQTVRRIAPAARLLVIGPAWPNGARPSVLLHVRDQIRDAALQVGADWVDPVEEGWFSSTPELIGKDGVHPTDAGHTYLADQIEPHIRDELTKVGQ